MEKVGADTTDKKGSRGGIPTDGTGLSIERRQKDEDTGDGEIVQTSRDALDVDVRIEAIHYKQSNTTFVFPFLTR